MSDATEPGEDGSAGPDPEMLKKIGVQRPAQAPTRAGRSRLPLYIFAAVVVVAVIAALVYWLLTKDQESTDDAYTDGRVIMVAPQVAGYVTRLAVDDNQFVHTGDLLISIDPSQYLAARDHATGLVRQTEAELAEATIAYEKMRVTAPAALLAAQGQLAEAEAQLTQTKAEYRRQHHVDRAATSQQNVDQADASFVRARGQVEEAQARVIEEQLVPQNIAQAAARVDQLKGQLAQAQANLATAQLNLGYTRITAPQEGWITKRNIEVGDFATVDVPIAAIVSPQIWVTANFKETQLDRMRRGERVTISIDAYPSHTLYGHVDSIQLGSGSRFSAFPAENATGNFVKIVQRIPVKIVIDRGIDPRRPFPLGASVVPTVALK